MCDPIEKDAVQRRRATPSGTLIPIYRRAGHDETAAGFPFGRRYRPSDLDHRVSMPRGPASRRSHEAAKARRVHRALAAAELQLPLRPLEALSGVRAAVGQVAGLREPHQ